MWFDPAVVEWAVEVTPSWLLVLLILLSYLGSATFLTPLVAAWYLLRPRRRILAWLGVLLVTYVARAIAKSFSTLDRPEARPDLHYEWLPWPLELVFAHPIDIGTTAFPSGHAVLAVVFWGLLAWELDIWTRARRAAVASGIVIVVGVARVVAGAHYVGDIVVGTVLGLLILTVMLVILERSAKPVEVTFALAGMLGLGYVLVTETTTGERTVAVAVGIFAGLIVERSGRIRRALRTAQGEQAIRAIGAPIFFVVAGIGAYGTGALNPTLAVLTIGAAISVHWTVVRARLTDVSVN